MTFLLQAALLGAVVFIDQDLPGLEVGTRVFPADTPPINARAVDVNRDGQADLVLNGTVRLQIAGKFPETGLIRAPEHGAFQATFVNGDLFYGLNPGRIVCYRLIENTWSKFWEAPLPAGLVEHVSPLFEDIDGDGAIEMTIAGESGLSVYRLSLGADLVGDLAVYPPARPDNSPSHDLWTENRTLTGAPTLSRLFQVSVSGDTLTLYQTLTGVRHVTQHRFSHFTVERMPNGGFQAAPLGTPLTVTVPRGMNPCRLNRDDVIDFAGAEAVELAEISLLRPLVDVYLSVDAGNTVQQIRAKSIPQFVSAADIDGDGDDDLIIEANDLLNGPQREVLLALASDRRLVHSVSAHVQEVGGNFDRSARTLLRTTIRFDGPAMAGGARWNAYRSGGLSFAHSDVDGDGRADVVVWDAPDRISVHLNHEGMFRRSPDTSLAAPAGFERMTAADIDGDGKSDIVLLPLPDSTAAPKVFFSR